MKRTVQLVLALVVLAGIGLLIWKNPASAPGNGSSDPAQVLSDDWVKGAPMAQVTIMEYADFECPACQVYNGWIKQLEREYAGRIRFVFRYFPLPSHRNGRLSSYAAEAAGRQGKFWQMHGLLFDNQDQWAGQNDPMPTFEKFAKIIELDVEQFRKDIETDAVKDRVNRDVASGTRLRVNATPTLFLNGAKAESPRDYESLKKLVDTLLAS